MVPYTLGTSKNECIRHRAERKDHVWALDFIRERTVHGQPVKLLGIVDEYTRECLALEVSRSITADRVLDHTRFHRRSGQQATQTVFLRGLVIQPIHLSRLLRF